MEAEGLARVERERRNHVRELWDTDADAHAARETWAQAVEAAEAARQAAAVALRAEQDAQRADLELDT